MAGRGVFNEAAFVSELSVCHWLSVQQIQAPVCFHRVCMCGL